MLSNIPEPLITKVSIPSTERLKSKYESTDRALCAYLEKKRGAEVKRSPLHELARKTLSELCDEVLKEIAADS